MEAEQKINMTLDDIIMYERIKKETESLASHNSSRSFRANGTWSNKQNPSGDPNSVQNLYYSHSGPLGHRNHKRFGPSLHRPYKNGLNTPYWRSRVRYATQFLNRNHQAQLQTQQRPIASMLARNNKLLTLKRLQTARALTMKMTPRPRRDSDTLSVVIPNETAMRRRAALRARSASQLTERNIRKFNALTGNLLMSSQNGSAYSADYRSRRSRSASAGRLSRPGSVARNYAGSLGRHSRAGTPVNSEASGYSVKNFYNRLLSYGAQRQIAILQGKSVPVDTSGRPHIFSRGFGLDFDAIPVGTSETLHERVSVLLQNL